MKLRSLLIFNILFFIFNLSVAHAGVCIWRFPDKDIQTLFSKATGYKTEVLTYTKDQKLLIEKELGYKLDDDETKFNFYRILKDSTEIGLVLTHSAKGQYGVIEVVIGLKYKADTTAKDTNAFVTGVLIQRDREIKSKELRSSKFLEQFLGKSVKSEFDDIELVKGAEKASRAVILSVRKLLIVNKILGYVPNYLEE